MQLVLSAISAGGLIGAADQYLCILILSAGAKLNLITLSPDMNFMMSWWFIGIVAFFWVLTNAPAFSSHLSPGIMHVINTIINFLSGFIVPVSAAIISLASIGVISSMHPDLKPILESLKLFNPEGGIGLTGWAVAGSSAVGATALTAMKALAKPAISTSTGTVGTVSTPMYAILENAGSIIVMVLAYVLTNVDPWLLVALFGVIILLTLILLAFAIYQLVRLRRGIGKALSLAQKNPRAGLAIITEFVVWGLGWFAWGKWARGVIMFLAWVLWLALFISLSAVVTAIFAFIPPLLPALIAFSTISMLVIFLFVGISSARSLMRIVEQELPVPESIS